MPEETKILEQKESEVVFSLGLTPEDDDILDRKIAIPYTTTSPTFTPKTNGVRRIYFDGSSYFLRVYANGGWRSFAEEGANARIFAASSTNNIADQTDTQITLDSTDFSSGVTVGTNKLTIATAGKYLVIGSVYFGNPTADKLYKAIIYAGNPASSKSTAHQHTSTTSGVVVVVKDILSLSVGDEIKLYAWHNKGSADNATSGQYLTFLSVAKM